MYFSLSFSSLPCARDTLTILRLARSQTDLASLVLVLDKPLHHTLPLPVLFQPILEAGSSCVHAAAGLLQTLDFRSSRAAMSVRVREMRES